MTGDPLLTRTPIFKGRVVELNLDEVRMPDGTSTTMEVIRHRGAGATLALLDEPGSEDPRLLLIRQYRYPCGGEILEIPAGLPEEGEDFESCAGRELAEETGWRAGSLRFLTRFFTTPGFTDEMVHLYLATDLSPVEQRRDPDEFIQLLAVPLSQALGWIRDGTIQDAKTAVALLLFAATRQEF